MRVLVTGATGYVGGRLISRLLERGHAVRILVRNAARVRGRPWAKRVDIVEGDLLQPSTLGPVVAGIDAAYYLVHSMTAGNNFEQRDRDAATHFVDAARDANLKHVIYLGGLLSKDDTAASKHLQSRTETGRILREGLPVTELRAGPIIGSGSASFEMVRYLTERLPVMIAPKWIFNHVRPVAVRDILSYLVETLDHEPLGIVSIGSDTITFKQMMLDYAAVRGLWRKIFPVPVLAPALAARWVGLVTPIPNRLAVPLVRGLTQSLDAPVDRAAELFPDIQPIDYRTAVELALRRTDSNAVETRWSGALGENKSFELADWEGLIREVRQVDTNVTPRRMFETVTSLGGAKGWLVWGWAWKLRGFMDQLIGGPGLRRGRRHPTEVLPGETIDFWRVEAVEPDRLLRLRAEMKVPGKAWLQFEIGETPGDETGTTSLTQTALFEPRGVPGFFYWWLLYPLHSLIFTDMVKAIKREAEQGAATHAPPTTQATSSQDTAA